MLHLADGFGTLSLGQTLPVAKSALSQWQPGPTFKEHKAIVYKRYLEGKTKYLSDQHMSNLRDRILRYCLYTP